MFKIAAVILQEYAQDRAPLFIDVIDVYVAVMSQVMSPLTITISFTQ